jgi:hypothetical protein
MALRNAKRKQRGSDAGNGSNVEAMSVDANGEIEQNDEEDNSNNANDDSESSTGTTAESQREAERRPKNNVNLPKPGRNGRFMLKMILLNPFPIANLLFGIYAGVWASTKDGKMQTPPQPDSLGNLSLLIKTIWVSNFNLLF